MLVFTQDTGEVYQLGSGLTNSDWSIFGGASTLAGLSDVSITTPSNGQLLVYNSVGSQWENQSVPILPTGTSGGSILYWDSVGWVEDTDFSVGSTTFFVTKTGDVNIGSSSSVELISGSEVISVGSAFGVNLLTNSQIVIGYNLGPFLQVDSTEVVVAGDFRVSTGFRFGVAGMGLFGVSAISQQAIPTSPTDAFTKLQSYGLFGAGAITTNLNSLDDVSAPSPANGDTIQYNTLTSQWESGPGTPGPTGPPGPPGRTPYPVEVLFNPGLF